MRGRREGEMGKCSKEGCNNQVNPPKGTIQYYCSKKCRYLGRGSKRAKRLAKRLGG
jgi:hypothetical protein